MEISRWLFLQFINPPSSAMSVFFFFLFFFNATAVISGRVVPPILWAENTSLGRVVVPGPSPHSILRSLIAPHRSAAPFQHNNSIVAPGASCHPELSFVLPFVISPRLNVFSLCDCPVSPLIITTDHITWTEWKRQNDGYTLWTVCTHCKFSPLSLKVDETHLLQDIHSINEWQCWFDVNLFMVWKFLAWSFPLDDNPLPFRVTTIPPSPPPLTVVFSSKCKCSCCSCSCLKRRSLHKETHCLSVQHGTLAPAPLSCLLFSCCMWRRDFYRATDKHALRQSEGKGSLISQ